MKRLYNLELGNNFIFIICFRDIYRPIDTEVNKIGRVKRQKM